MCAQYQFVVFRSLFLAAVASYFYSVASLQAEDSAAPAAQLTRGSIYGTVVDNAGKSIAGTEVRLHQWEDATRNYGAANAKRISDANGKFEFAPLDDGSFVIAADYAGLATTRFSTILQDKAHQKFEIVLRPATTPIIKLQSPDGKPIVGATLQEFKCRNASGELHVSTRNWQNLGLQISPSDAQGKLQLPALPEGTVIVDATFVHPEHAPHKLKDVATGSGTIATVNMGPGARLRLKIDSSAGQEPIAEVKLSLSHSDRESPSECYERPMPVRDGVVELVVTPGQYDSIQLQHDKYFISPTYRKPDISECIEIGAERENEFKFQLHKRVQVRGRVIDATSRKPINEAFVYAQVSNQPATDWTSVRGTETKATGEFMLEAPAGTARLSVICDDYTLGKAYLETRIAEGESQKLPDVELHRNPVIKGRVLDLDGKPVAGAILRMQGILKFMRHAPAATDSEGRFELPLRRVPENFDNDSVELAWTQPLEVFHPLRPLSARIDVRLDQPESVSNMTIQLQSESAEELLRIAQVPTTEWERKADKVRAEMSANNPDITTGKTPPELDGQLWLNTDSAAPTLASFRGKYVLLDFWTVWCGPCHADFPEVKLLYETYKDHGLVVIGVHDNSVDADSVREHVRQQGLKFPIVVDRREGGILAAYKKFSLVTGYPSYVLVGPDGKILPSDTIVSYKFETIRNYLLSRPQAPK
jgi:thiol-disulfide isomerase/thioredoxin